MATALAGEALGMEGELGVIAEGALADIILIDTSRPHLHPMNDTVATLVYCGKASDVDMVVVNGRIVVNNGRVSGLDYPTLYTEVDSRIRAIKSR
jgi:5-methylthioadenosine/S-adenosylhomocysteine deaminase